MEAATALTVWRGHRLPRVVAAEWDPWAARLALAEIRRLRSELEAAQAAFVQVLSAETGRDTRAALVRHAGMSSRDARDAERVAEVTARVPGAGEALAEGRVGAGHLALLAPITDAAEAVDLLALATSQPVDEFATTVRRHHVERDAASVRDRQRNARSMSFFRADDGNVGMRAILTPLDGERIKAMVNRRCDERWRAEHPDRAPMLGGHHGEPRERRLADAFVELMTGGGSDVTLPPGREAGTGASGVGVVVVLDAEAMRAHIGGTAQPLAPDDLVDAVQQARSDLYAAVRSSTGAILHFGRSRRYATAIQKLALVARDGGRCCWSGCDEPWHRCDVDHVVDWEQGGTTDLENLRLLCRRHHAHRHETGAEPDRPDPPPPQWRPGEGPDSCGPSHADRAPRSRC
jgi:hypothetical protein